MQVLQRYVDRVIERGGAGRFRSADRLFHLVEVGSELGEREHPIVELHYLHLVARLERADEAHRRLLGELELRAHAARRVHENHHSKRELAPGKELELLLDTVLEDLEVILRQVGHEPSFLIRHGHREAHGIDAHAELRAVLGGAVLLRESDGRAECGHESPDRGQASRSHGGLAWILDRRSEARVSAASASFPGSSLGPESFRLLEPRARFLEGGSARRVFSSAPRLKPRSPISLSTQRPFACAAMRISFHSLGFNRWRNERLAAASESAFGRS